MKSEAKDPRGGGRGTGEGGGPSDGIGPEDHRRLKRLHRTGSQPYTDRELIARRELIGRQFNAVLAQAREKGMDLDEMWARAGEDEPRQIWTFPDTGSLGDEEMDDEGLGVPDEDADEPCCTEQQIQQEKVRILAAYAAAVNRVNRWLGCQDWAVRVHQAVNAVIGPCWIGKFIWRINVWPLGRWTPFDDGDTWIHHAYAICPCTCDGFGGCPECIVLDPYTISGFAFMQSASTVPMSEWIDEGSVWRASTDPDHDNGTIYRYTMRYYCRRAGRGWAQRATCRLVRDLLKRELARYTGATGEVLDRLYREYGLDPDCC